MRTDTYVKAVLTVIAIMLTVIACKPLYSPETVAQAQGPNSSVQFSGGNEGTFSLYDSRTGDAWIYYAHGNGPMVVAHAKVISPGSPTSFSYDVKR